MKSFNDVSVKDERDETKVVIVRKNNHLLNKLGDWKQAEQRVKTLETYGKVIEELVDDLAKIIEKYNAEALAAYNSAPKIDLLFYDSPLSPAKMTLDLKRYIKKAGIPVIRDVHEPSISIKKFSDSVREACSWLLKFKNAKDV